MVPEGWTKTLLGNVMEFKNGLNFTKKDTGEAIKIVGVADFKDLNELHSTDLLDVVNVANKIRDEELLNNGDLLFVRSNGNKKLIGRCLYFPSVSERLSFSGFTIRGRVKQDLVIPQYIAALARSSLMKQQMSKNGGGTNISNLSQQILNDIVLPLPKINEQKKITQILSTWDKAIATTEQLLRNSLQLKNTLMQTVITGKKRFPEFKGQREKRTLSDICILGAGQPAPQKEKYFIHGNHDFIRVSDLGSNTSRWAPQSRDKINQLAIRECKLEVVPARATLFTKSGASLLLNQRAQLKECSFIVSHLGFAKAKDGVSDDFVFYLMCSIDFNRYAAGTSLPALQLSVLKSLKVLLPPYQEQKKIASILSDADAEISILEKKLFLLKQEKKALMQQLLTGKRRVKTEAA